MKVLADQFQSKPAEIKRFVRDHLESALTGELVERMRMAVARGVQTPIESPRANPTPLKSAPKTKIGPAGSTRYQKSYYRFGTVLYYSCRLAKWSGCARKLET